MKKMLTISFVFFNLTMFSQTFLAQNISTSWKGLTASTVTYAFTGSNPQAIAQFMYSPPKTFVINNGFGSDRRVAKTADISYTITFSPAVPANEIAFSIIDLDAAVIPIPSSPTTTFTFAVSGTATTNDFANNLLTGAPVTMNYNATTGLISSIGAFADQMIMLVGSGNNTVSSITVTSSGINATDLLAYSFYALDLTILPIKLDYFTAVNVNCERIINWKTSSENNVSLFEVQSSNDGLNYNTIKTINPFNYAATYKYVDQNNNTADKTFYRLKTIDIGGNIEYSNVSTVSNCIAKKNVFFNFDRITNQITIKSGEKEYEIRLFDLNGKIILKKKMQNEIEYISLLNYSKQVYILSITDKFGKNILTEKIAY